MFGIDDSWDEMMISLPPTGMLIVLHPQIKDVVPTAHTLAINR